MPAVAVHYRYSVHPLFPAHLVTYTGRYNSKLHASVWRDSKGLESRKNQDGILRIEGIIGLATTTMRQQARQDLEVGDGFLPEFEGIEKGGIRKLGGVGEEELKSRPHYPANISRQRRVVGDSDVTFLGIGSKKPKKAGEERRPSTNNSCSRELLIMLLRIL
jgi:hypothetical protein